MMGSPMACYRTCDQEPCLDGEAGGRGVNGFP